MDTTALIASAKTRFNHNSAKAYLKDKYESKLIFADQGGLWKITPDFLTFLSVGINKRFVMLDTYENPIKIDSTTLLTKATAIYNEVMEAWHAEYEELKNKR